MTHETARKEYEGKATRGMVCSGCILHAGIGRFKAIFRVRGKRPIVGIYPSQRAAFLALSQMEAIS